MCIIFHRSAAGNCRTGMFRMVRCQERNHHSLIWHYLFLKTQSFMMPADKCPSILSRQMEAIFCISFLDRYCRSPIERIHSRVQQLCKFIATKESVNIQKEFNSHRFGLVNQHGRLLIILDPQYGCCDVMCIHSIVSLGIWGYRMLLFRTQIPNGQAS